MVLCYGSPRKCSIRTYSLPGKVLYKFTWFSYWTSEGTLLLLLLPPFISHLTEALTGYVMYPWLAKKVNVILRLWARFPNTYALQHWKYWYFLLLFREICCVSACVCASSQALSIGNCQRTSVDFSWSTCDYEPKEQRLTFWWQLDLHIPKEKLRSRWLSNGHSELEQHLHNNICKPSSEYLITKDE